jgi:hypothetical protein
LRGKQNLYPLFCRPVRYKNADLFQFSSYEKCTMTFMWNTIHSWCPVYFLSASLILYSLLWRHFLHLSALLYNDIFFNKHLNFWGVKKTHVLLMSDEVWMSTGQMSDKFLLVSETLHFIIHLDQWKKNYFKNCVYTCMYMHTYVNNFLSDHIL